MSKEEDLYAMIAVSVNMSLSLCVHICLSVSTFPLSLCVWDTDRVSESQSSLCDSVCIYLSPFSVCVNICTFAVAAMYISASLCNSVHGLGFRV
jgi:hypothetical protein